MYDMPQASVEEGVNALFYGTTVVLLLLRSYEGLVLLRFRMRDNYSPRTVDVGASFRRNHDSSLLCSNI